MKGNGNAERGSIEINTGGTEARERDRDHRGYGQSWLPRQLVFMKGFNLKLLVAP